MYMYVCIYICVYIFTYILTYMYTYTLISALCYYNKIAGQSTHEEKEVYLAHDFAGSKSKMEQPHCLAPGDCG
jgi:hypothetical protein